MQQNGNLNMVQKYSSKSRKSKINNRDVHECQYACLYKILCADGYELGESMGRFGGNPVASNWGEEHAQVRFSV